MVDLCELQNHGESDCRRFASKVEVVGECWIWTGGKRAGYGVFWADGKNQSAHRWSFNKFVRKTLKKYVVCHKCDNPLCVNPAHLFQGTHSTNMRDASRKNRLSNKKLTKAQIEYILQSPESDAVMAEKFGVWYTTIRRVRINKDKSCEI